MKYKAVFFDLDGTLLNTLGDLTASCNYMLQKYQYDQVSIAQVQAALGNGIKKLVERVLPADVSEKRYQECLMTFETYYQEHVDVETVPYEGIIELLKQLKENKIKIVIVSNKFRNGVEKLATKFFAGLVDVALGPDEVLKTKPDLSMLNYALEKLNLNHTDVLYVGDSGVDITTAQAAGMKMLTVTWGFRTKEELSSNYCNLTFVDKATEISEYLNLK